MAAEGQPCVEALVTTIRVERGQRALLDGGVRR